MLIPKLVALSISAFLISCGSSNVAKDYIAQGGPQTAADATPDAEDAEKPADDTAGEDGTGTDTEEGTDDTSAPAGDVTKGNALLQNCVACHNSGGLAKNMTLNAAAVSRLDAAFTGAQSAFHSVLPEAFEAPGRADLEAALNAIP